MSLAHWSWRRVAIACFVWLLGFAPLGLMALYARTALLNPASNGDSVSGANGLEIVLEFPSTAATVLTVLWLGPPLLLLVIWLHVRVRGGESGSL